MNLQEVFKKIELALTPSQEEVKVEFANMKLADGTLLEAEAFEAGRNVFLVGEDDEKVAAPVGEHTLEDGMILVIVEEGVISEIKEAAEEVAEEAPEVELEVEQAADEYVSKQEFESAVSEIKEMIQAMMPKEEEMKAEESVELELSADEAPAAKKVAAAPVEKKIEMNQIASKGGRNTLSRVMSKLA